MNCNMRHGVMTMKELRVFKKEQLGDEESIILCSNKSTPADLTQEEWEELKDMADYFLNQSQKKKTS